MADLSDDDVERLSQRVADLILSKLTRGARLGKPATGRNAASANILLPVQIPEHVAAAVRARRARKGVY